MAWYTDEQYEMIKDSREKKSIAASAFKQKTHCGKGGRVKFPSDYMSRKELNAMNGECKSYRMNDPISWSEFVGWPNEHKSAYIRRLRERFGVDDKHIAEMFDVACNLFLMYVRELGLDTKTECDENWNREKFYAWRSGGRTELVEEGISKPFAEPDLTKPMSLADFKLLTDEQKIEYIKWIRETFGAPDRWIGIEVFGMSQSGFAKYISALNIGPGRNSKNHKTKWDKEGFLRWCNMKTEDSAAEEIVSVPLVEEVGEERAEAVSTDELFQKHVENIENERRKFTREEREVCAEKAFDKRLVAVETENDIPVSTDEYIGHNDPRGPEGACGETHNAVPVDGEMNFKGNIDDILRTIRILLDGHNVSLTVSWRVMEG